ncbi:MAG: tetratricopeptide repeat protein [Alteromonadaceae bacterium]|nr:tetratricopeptide repeat protein [Alteromonadaceae bacterium]
MFFTTLKVCFSNGSSHLLIKGFLLPFLCALTLLLSFLAHAAIPDDEFQALRGEMSAASNKSPLDGIAKADEILNRLGNELGLGQRVRVLYLKSWYQINADRIEAALKTLADARLLAKDISEPGILYSYYSISASAFANLELYELALENHLNAYKEAPLLGRPQFIHQTENNIGHIYMKLGLLEQAEDYFQRFYDSAVELELTTQQAVAMNNLGEVAYFRGDLSKALELHNAALKIRQDNNLTYHETWSLYNLGRVYASKEDFEPARQFFRQAITRWTNQGAESKTLEPKLALAETLLMEARPQEANELIEQVIKVAEQQNLFIPLQAALLAKSNVKRKLGDVNGALAAQDKYNRISAAYSEKRSSVGLTYMLSQTELRTNEMALRQLQQEHELSLTVAAAERRQALVIFISAFVIIGISLFFLYRLARRKQQLQELLSKLEVTQSKLVESEKMRAMTTLVSGMAHQLNTPLGLVITANSTLSDLVTNLSKQFSDKKLTQSKLAHFMGKALELLELSQGNSQKAANLIQRFKMMSAKLQITELAEFELLEFLREKVAGIDALKHREIGVDISGRSVRVTNYAPVIEKVFTQLVENSIKHGFANTKAPQIDIEIENADDSQVIIHYKDNGVGIPQEKRRQVFDPFYTTRMGEGSLGLGLNVIYNSIVHLMHGHVECMVDAQGAHFVLFIPKIVKHSEPSTESIQIATE